MVDEVCTHMNKMLEVGTIYPSHRPWCNTVVLVHKKDGGLHFCIDFHKLNAQDQEGFFSTAPHPRSH